MYETSRECGAFMTGLGGPDRCHLEPGHDGWHAGVRGSYWAPEASA